MPDIDIDTQSNFQPEKVFKNIVLASTIKKQEITKHPVGVYFQNIPVDPISGFSAIPYDKAEKLGYFKIDFLHLSLLDVFESKKQIRVLLKKQPNWNLLKIPSVVSKLFHLSNHYNIVNKISPTSIEELADCLALIRPAKRYLLNDYLKDRDSVRKILYQKPSNEKVWFKKSHSIAYAHNIVLQLHLIEAGIEF